VPGPSAAEDLKMDVAKAFGMVQPGASDTQGRGWEGLSLPPERGPGCPGFAPGFF